VVVTELGTRADEAKDRIEVSGRRIVRRRPVYILLNKPRQTVTTLSDPEGRKTVIDVLAGLEDKVFPVGRLDYNTSGALLLTNDGELAQALAHPSAGALRVYSVKVQGQVSDETIERLASGVMLDDGPARPVRVGIAGVTDATTTIQLVLREGRNREVRRMIEAVGHRVGKLTRVSFAGLGIEGLRPGQWRRLTPQELARLKKDFLTPYRRRTRGLTRLPHDDPA
jgi:pseudouridine synthase